MKIVQINSVCGIGSTGKICVAISELLNEKNIENYILYSMGNSDYKQGIKYSNDKYIKVQALFSRILGNYGFNSYFATKKLISKLKSMNPDVIHLHNIHSHDCNLTVLFEFIKKNNIKVFWTFHDCWTITGYCTHFDMIGCDKWKTACKNCPQAKDFSWFFDRSAYLYKKKKEIFKELDLTIITPSKWLAGLVRQSIAGEYPVKVINNGIDLNVFKPTDSEFRKKYNCENKFIILGVAFGWDVRKGLDVFVELSKRLDDRFQIVLVGTDENVDKQLPDNIISIHRTQNQKELAEIYTAADLFVNPTREEALGLVNIESLACGTPVVTFNTGGAPECIDNTCGIVVEKNDIDAMYNEIIKIYNHNPYSKSDCTNRANTFDKYDKFKEYVDLY